MKFKVVEISKADFSKISENERIFYIKIGHLCNEITVLEKLLFLSTTFSHPDEYLDSINAAQSLLISRLTAGKLWEGWRLLQEFFDLGSKRPSLPISIEADFSPEASSAFDDLKIYFKKNNLIDVLRNQFAFHYMPGNLKKHPPNLNDIDKLEILVTEKDEPYAIFSEEVMVRMILRKIDGTDSEKAEVKMIEEVMKITHAFRKFCFESLFLMLNKYGTTSPKLESDFPHLNSNKKLDIPFLFSDYK